jgi:hypothetical protein
MLAGILSVGSACIFDTLALGPRFFVAAHKHEDCTHGGERIGIAAFFSMNLIVEDRVDCRTEIDDIKKSK